MDFITKIILPWAVSEYSAKCHAFITAEFIIFLPLFTCEDRIAYVWELRMKVSMVYRRIRDLREDRDLTQVQMGRQLNCSQRVYSNYERGDIDVPTQILIKLADFYDVSVDYLLGRTDKPEVNR